MRYLLGLIILLHGQIHLMGFAKAYRYGNIPQLTKDISKPAGLLWLAATLLFTATAILFLLKKDAWIFIGIVAVLLSQALIFGTWRDAKPGTIANILIIGIVILSSGIIWFEKSYRKDVLQNLRRSDSVRTEILTETDLERLPQPVKRYLRYAAVLDKPKVKNMKVVFEGEMRNRKKDWFPFTTEQYNFFDTPARLFFMKAKMSGITVPGYHRYVDARASMDVRLFGIFTVASHSGEVMNKAETVTLFNEMCLLAPASLIDKRIAWQSLDSNSAKATFTNQDISISAVLYFNKYGQLINFVSEDRTDISDMKQYPFSTPVTEYDSFNNVNILSNGEAAWHYPEGKFTYGKFRLKSIEYNVTGLD